MLSSKIKGATRTLLAFIPTVGGGLAQAWTEYDARKQEALIQRLVEESAELLERLDDPAARRQLIGRLRELLSNPPSGGYEDPVADHQQEWRRVLGGILRTEIPRQLKTIDPSSRGAIEQASEYLLETNVSFRSRLTKDVKARLVSDFNAGLARARVASSMLGITAAAQNGALAGELPIRIAFPPIMLAVSAIFFYMRDIRRYNLLLDFAHPHALELATLIAHGTIVPDACALGDAPALEVIRSLGKKYPFAMFLPKSEERAAAPYRTRSKGAVDGYGEFHFICERDSTTLFYYEELRRKRLIGGGDFSLEPHESIRALRSNDQNMRLLLWTPHWQVYERYHLARLLDLPSYHFDTLLFLNREFRDERPLASEALEIAIRDAWLALLVDAHVREETVRAMLRDEKYAVYLFRICGLHQDFSGTSDPQGR